MAVQDRPAPEALTDRVPPVALLLTGATSVQFGAALAATLFDDVGPAGTSMLRLVLSAAVLALFWRPAIRGLRAADRRLVVAFGLALGLMNFSFYEALDRVPLGVAVTIEFIGPVSVAVALSRRRLDFVWIALAVVGIVLLADPFGAGGIDPVGLVFVLVAAACWAAYILLAQRTAGRFRGGEGLALAALVAALIPIVPGVAEAGTDLLAPEILALGLCVAVLSSVIPYSLETVALRRMPAHLFGVLMSLEPVVAAIAGLVVLGQHLGATDLVAIGLVVAASIGATQSSRTTVPVDLQ
jgi:inner membrane transporter RhtA